MANNKKILIEKPGSNEMCPVGYHVVKGHKRTCHNGTKTWVDAHQRKNAKWRKIYLSENLLHLFWNNKKKYNKIKRIKGYPPHHELDEIILFWPDYWKEQGVGFPNGLKPLHVKAMIAVESSFDPKARAKTTTATGLMQVLKTALRALKGTKNIRQNEVRNNFIYVTSDQLLDPVVNIAVGIRWLAHKYFLLRNRKDKSLKTVIRNYHSKDKAGDKYAEKVLKLYEKSK